MRLFEEAVSGKSSMSEEALLLYVYGQYLLNGGRRDDFLDFTMDDVQIMATVMLGNHRRSASTIANAVGRILFKSDGND